ncbi:Sec-independent protein translocase protein TatB [Ralstonia solanacearum]|uniref:Sec-independent protein translocase protein TatB n=1 Tax=Ralstonia solanacearum (strain Po82) TaxID=1031711 RepID=F6FXY0_RALS8|nr:Sec-independent protein translocase protein TatB [Ralstonia solanacearum]AEG67863.1 sec-independent protein translocase-like protein tatb [Ralstonia solanacearum Po82]AMP69198.1 preprotein translocase [Ralstonia solanacearum]AMP73889.1 preprotein translocase [Ralstonia solanacearum]AYB59574.1 twin-arginine translocase subunit TatB [Ralstonia solanacearum]MBB6586352.1 Sec-independent protein translocase subunit TatB [Ralstonia solanacearum]
MIDLGISKLALIGAVALVVIGPERLPKVARTAGALIGRAQRYIADVKAEVSREIELEELRKMRTEFEEAARNVEQTIHQEVSKHTSEINERLNEALGDPAVRQTATQAPEWRPAPAKSRNGRNSWRNKQLAMPKWYRRKQGVSMWAQSGAARVKRHRPPIVAAQSRGRSFFE